MQLFFSFSWCIFCNIFRLKLHITFVFHFFFEIGLQKTSLYSFSRFWAVAHVFSNADHPCLLGSDPRRSRRIRRPRTSATAAPSGDTQFKSTPASPTSGSSSMRPVSLNVDSSSTSKVNAKADSNSSSTVHANDCTPICCHQQPSCSNLFQAIDCR